MAREFKLPDIGEGLTEAEVVRWLVAEGDRVEADQPLVEVETDKAVVEIPSPYAGTVLRHGGVEGETIAVGAVLAVIGEPGEDTEALEEPAAGLAPPIVGTLVEEAEDLGRREPTADTGRVKALPIVRKLAREMGVDLESVDGTGPEGRVTRDDVLAAAQAGVGEAPISPPSEPLPPPGSEAASPPSERSERWGEYPEGERGAQETDLHGDEGVGQESSGTPEADARRPLSRLRKTIAANMSRSWAEIPHVTTFDDIDATRLLEVREALGERHGVKLPLEALVIKAVIPALESHPEFNATLDGEDLILHHRFDIGIAVDTPDGLLVGVVRDAGARSVMELGAEVRRLGEGARARSLAPDELTGQTFTVSNIGAVGGGHGTPIVPYGTTGILSVGRAVDRPIAIDGELVIAPVIPLSLSYDHRVIDGGLGRRFMAMVRENLEEPALFLA